MTVFSREMSNECVSELEPLISAEVQCLFEKAI